MKRKQGTWVTHSVIHNSNNSSSSSTNVAVDVEKKDKKTKTEEEKTRSIHKDPREEMKRK